MCEVARRCGAEVVRVEAPVGPGPRPATAARPRHAHPDARLLAVVHAETSTGVENEVAPLAALRDTDTLLVVDTVTPSGGIPVEVDGWGIDAVLLGHPEVPRRPARPRAGELLRAGPVARIRGRTRRRPSPGTSTSASSSATSAARAATTTPRPSRCCRLHAGLGAMLDEGLEASWARHRRVGARLQHELPRLGFRLLAEEIAGCPSSPRSWLPDGVDDATLRKELLHRFGIEVGGGLGEFAGQGLADRAHGPRRPRPHRHHAARRAPRPAPMTGPGSGRCRRFDRRRIVSR